MTKPIRMNEETNKIINEHVTRMKAIAKEAGERPPRKEDLLHVIVLEGLKGLNKRKAKWN